MSPVERPPATARTLKAKKAGQAKASSGEARAKRLADETLSAIIAANLPSTVPNEMSTEELQAKQSSRINNERLMRANDNKTTDNPSTSTQPLTELGLQVLREAEKQAITRREKEREAEREEERKRRAEQKAEETSLHEKCLLDLNTHLNFLSGNPFLNTVLYCIEINEMIYELCFQCLLSVFV